MKLSVILCLSVICFGFLGVQPYDTHEALTNLRTQTADRETISPENVEHLTALRVIATDSNPLNSIYDVAFNSDSTLLAYVASQEAVLWDIGTQAVIWRFPVSFGTTVAFSPDNEVLAVAANQSIYVWTDVRDGRAWYELRQTDNRKLGSVSDVRFSPDGAELVAVIEQSYGLFRWDVDSRELVLVEYLPYTDETSTVHAAILSRDGQIGAIHKYPQTIEFVDTLVDQTLGVAYLNNFFSDRDESSISATLLTFSFDSQQLLVNVDTPQGAQKSSLIYLDISGGLVQEIEYDYNALWQTGSFSPDGKLLVLSNAVDETLYFFEAASNQEIFTIDSLGTPIRSAIFSPDGAYLATGDSNGTVRLWGVGQLHQDES